MRDTAVLTVLRGRGRTWLGVRPSRAPDRFGSDAQERRSPDAPSRQAGGRRLPDWSARDPGPSDPALAPEPFSDGGLQSGQRAADHLASTTAPTTAGQAAYRADGSCPIRPSGRPVGMASPEMIHGQGRGRRKSRQGSPDSRGPQVAFAVAGHGDALVMGFARVATPAAMSVAMSAATS